MLITVDTLRAHALDCSGAADAGTPAIDALAAEGVRFEHAYAPRGLTLPSSTTIHTGVSPLTRGAVRNGWSLALGPPTLPGPRRAAGYRTHPEVEEEPRQLGDVR